VYLQGMRLHRWVGNPVLSCVGRAVSGAAVGDFHCGLRGVRRDDVLRLGLRADGMEFASEMILTAAAHGLRIVEVPTTLAPDGRDRPPHLRTWRDGWRHLRLLLLLAPRWLFLYPGAAAAVAGGLLVAMLAPGPVRVGGVMFDVHTMLLGAALLAVGLQGVLLAVIAEAYGAAVGLWPTSSSRRALLDGWSVERGLIAGGALVTAGVGVALAETMWWADAGFGPLDVFRRDLILAVVAMVTGSQVASAGFLVGLARLGLERMDEPGPPPWAEWTPDERG
ncbi:MAG TPA: glycosyltransferase family 2 protein, partial [Myxococcota bacterium]|nr:glycosyltransferase family 2 protein [Myxococcota bacterium]